MTIKLHHDDFNAIASKMASVFSANGENRSVVDMRVERYGIPLKVSASKDSDENGRTFYRIDEVSFWGVNANNVSVAYDFDIMYSYGVVRY